MSAGTVKLTIDGQTVEVTKGTTILQAAEKLGIHIPRYCYHPGLEIVGICRICQVEIKGVPNPVISCYALAEDGQEVFTKSPMVERVRRADLEFLLINHPIDCPICDTSGECDLQNYYMTDGKHRSRLRHHKINRLKKTRIGARVVLDQERCILCSRCVRFLKDVTSTHELGFFGKGDRSYIDVVDGKALDGNIYAGNVVDLCPVGALTDDDFRFKCRVWYLKVAPSICPHCSNGCNIEIHFNTELCWKNDGKRIMRIKPRFNPHVNDYWMCDIGRYDYDFAENPTRLERPLVRRGDAQVETTWDEALKIAAERLQPLRVDKGCELAGCIPTPWMTNEAAFLFRKLFVDILGIEHVGFRKNGGEVGGDGFLLRNDRSPNRLGLELIVSEASRGGVPSEEVFRMAADNVLRILVCVECIPDRLPPEELIDAAAKGVDFLMVFASNASTLTERADLVLPVSPWSEENGTWVNWLGRLQWVTPALGPKGYSKNAVEAVALIGRRLGVDLGDGKSRTTFDELAKEISVFGGISYDDLVESGAGLPGYPGSRLEESSGRRERD